MRPRAAERTAGAAHSKPGGAAEQRAEAVVAAKQPAAKVAPAPEVLAEARIAAKEAAVRARAVAIGVAPVATPAARMRAPELAISRETP